MTVFDFMITSSLYQVVFDLFLWSYLGFINEIRLKIWQLPLNGFF